MDFEAFNNLREYIEELSSKKKQVFFIDEMPWLDNHKSKFLAAFEYFWNDYGTSKNNLIFVICGSATSWMVDNIANNKGGLFNRQTCRIYLEPFTLKQTKEFLLDQGISWSDYDIAECYMIMGGIPYYLSLLDASLSYVLNIDKSIDIIDSSIIDLKSIYSDLRNSSVVTEQTLLDVVDSYVSELNQSQLLNFKRWNIMNEKIHGNPKVFGSYEAEVENIRNFIKNRIVWIDNKLGYMPNALIHINNPDMRYWSRNETIFISGISSNANIQVFDLMGRIREYKSTSTDFTIPIEKGIYIVRIKET